MQPVSVKENSDFKPSVLCLKIDLASHAGHGEWVGWMQNHFHYVKVL